MTIKDEFLELAIAQGALRFGEFTLKSGRISPYFFNAGRFSDGGALASLGRCYAQSIAASRLAFDMLFGPAYKGIPLATAAAIAFAEQGRNLPCAFNRKEIKDHGEGGALMGAPLAGRVLIIDDVITAGTAIRESVGIIEAAGAHAVGVAIALDRQELGQGGILAMQEVEAQYGLKVVAIAALADLLTFVKNQPEMAATHDAIYSYRTQYGA
ncbi:MAG: orotate phosphoribosyltransferase [Gammaproteobacteria bacterium]